MISDDIFVLKLMLTKVQVDHKIHKILKIFDQITFQIAKSLCFFFAAIIDATSSGSEVQIATIVAQIKSSETHICFAI